MGQLADDRERLTPFLRRLHGRFPLEAAFLFGSRARGDELLHSDYDVILVSPGFASLGWIQRVVAVNDEWDLDAGLDVLPYTRDEWDRKRSEIGTVAEAMKDAVPLWP